MQHIYIYNVSMCKNIYDAYIYITKNRQGIQG